MLIKGLNPNEPFKDEKEERAVFLMFLDMLILASIYQDESAPQEATDRVGVLFCDAELMRSFETPEAKAFPQKAEFWDTFTGILLKCQCTIKAQENFPISKLVWSQLLSPVEILAFIMALSTAVSRKYEKVYAILSQEIVDACRPTVGLCLDFARFFLGNEDRNAALFYDSDSFLNKVLLEQPSSIKTTELARPLVLRQEVLLFLDGNQESFGSISLCGELLNTVYSKCNVHKKDEEDLFSIFSFSMLSDTDSVIFLVGDKGAGKRFLISRLSDAADRKAVSLDIGRLLALSEQKREDILADLSIKLILGNIILYLYNLPEDKGYVKELQYVFSYLQDYFDVIIVGIEKTLSKPIENMLHGTCYRIELSNPSTADQKALWEDALDYFNASLQEDANLDELVSKYVLNPGRIFESVRCAMAQAATLYINKDALENSIRSVSAVYFGENAKRISSPFSWDDLIIDEESKNLLRIACNRIRCKSIVNDDFGFGKKLPYGRGVAIVFYGPPGTGKTMAAQVLSKELALDLYRIDLSQISSKYIGETEKNLGSLFEAAKNSNAILFFDEADSLFAKRTEVSTSNDKHANAETAYLLQKIEEYSGVSILATNNLQNFDVAFKRRMTYIIPIGMPDEKTREELWQAAFPQKAPLSGDVNIRILAEVLEISGSSIKNSAIEAAYRAAAENRKITMNDILDALELECMKNGLMGAKNIVLSKLVSG